MKILISADGSPYTKRMLAYVVAHPEFFGPQHDYTVLTAVPSVPPRASVVIDKETLRDYYTEEADKVLAPVRAYAQEKGLPVKTEYKVGPPAEVISTTATNGKFDLIVMGTHGHSTLGKLVMGSVTTNVVAHCSVPVLLLR